MTFLLDFIFPPLCLSCKSRCKTKFLCPDCWELCRLPDPAGQCRHCFGELDERGNLCSRCREKKDLPAPRAFVFDPESPAHLLGYEPPEALAGFAYLQWIQLEWPLMDGIVPMPDSSSRSIGNALSQLMGVPLLSALNSQNSYREEYLDEDLELLLFDVNSSLEALRQSSISLLESFPKRIYILSLFPYVDRIP